MTPTHFIFAEKAETWCAKPQWRGQAVGPGADHPGFRLWEEQLLRALEPLKGLLGKGRKEMNGWVNDRPDRHIGSILLNLLKILLLKFHWEGSQVPDTKVRVIVLASLTIWH